MGEMPSLKMTKFIIPLDAPVTELLQQIFQLPPAMIELKNSGYYLRKAREAAVELKELEAGPANITTCMKIIEKAKEADDMYALALTCMAREARPRNN
jgi:hypothetical protein